MELTHFSTNAFSFSGRLISTCATYSAGNVTLKNSYLYSSAISHSLDDNQFKTFYLFSPRQKTPKSKSKQLE